MNRYALSIAPVVDGLLDRMDQTLEAFFGFPVEMVDKVLGSPRHRDGLQPQLAADITIIDGVELPQRVLDELKRLGVSMANYNAGELRAAVRACALDGTLVDDKNGVNFFDKLELTENEKAEDEGEIDVSPWRGKPPAGHGAMGFVDRLMLERESDILKSAGVDESPALCS